MRMITLATACAVAALCNVHGARADDSMKEAMGPMYEMQIAPKICGWKDAASSAKLDAQVADQEKALGISAADRADLLKKAEADLKSDPSDCTDGMLRAMYDEAVK
jgi:hypothetical protein